MSADEKTTAEEPHVHGPECQHEHGHEGHAPEHEDGEEKPEKLAQDVEIKDVGPCRKHIKVTVQRTDIDKKFDEKYKELVGESWVPGFRPGKAPRQIVVRKYKKEVDDQVKAQVLFASLEQLAEDHDIAPLSPPNLNPNTLVIPDKGDFVYEFEVEVRPSFELPEYKNLKLKRPVKEFNDEDVTQEEKRVLSRFGQRIPKDGAVELGDFITADMTSRMGPLTIGSAKEIVLRVDDTVAFRDGVASKFGEQVVGAKAGDSREVDIHLTEGVANESLKGQTAQATLEIKDVKSLRLPELTDDFLQETFGVNNLEQFHERVRLNLERRLQYRQRQSAREQVLAHITSASSWELPQDLLLRQARKALARRVMEMQEAGMSEEEISARRRLLERDVLNSTAASLKEHFVLQKVAEEEKIEVDEDEINDEIDTIADQTGESPRKVRAQFEREDLLDTLAAQIIERKALDLILESATYEDVPLGQETGMASVEAQAVEGEMKDPTAAPPEEKKEEQAEEPAAQA